MKYQAEYSLANALGFENDKEHSIVRRHAYEWLKDNYKSAPPGFFQRAKGLGNNTPAGCLVTIALEATKPKGNEGFVQMDIRIKQLEEWLKRHLQRLNNTIPVQAIVVLESEKRPRDDVPDPDQPPGKIQKIAALPESAAVEPGHLGRNWVFPRERNPDQSWQQKITPPAQEIAVLETRVSKRQRERKDAANKTGKVSERF